MSDLKKAALRCRIKSCGRVFASDYSGSRPYSEYWEHAKNMHGALLVEEITLTPDEIDATKKVEDEIPY